VNVFVPGGSVGPVLGSVLGAVLASWLGATDVPPPQAATRIAPPKSNANARWIGSRRIVSDSQAAAADPRPKIAGCGQIHIHDADAQRYAAVL
jgi:hypothetical protein